MDTVVGRQVCAVVNFPPRQIGKFMSEVLVLGVPDEDGEVILLRPDLDAPIGARMAHGMNPRPLKLLFALFLAITALNMGRVALGG